MQTPGLIVAPLTPFTADLEVDRPALRRQIDYVVTDCRATMVVAAGVETQEYTYLSLAGRKALIRRTIEFVDGRVPVEWLPHVPPAATLFLQPEGNKAANVVLAIDAAKREPAPTC